MFEATPLLPDPGSVLLVAASYFSSLKSLCKVDQP